VRRATRELGLFAVLAVFVIENQCGLGSADRQQLAVHFLEQGQYERALVEARRAVRQDGDASEPHVVEALAHLGLEQAPEAVTCLVRAIERAPDDPRLYETLRQVATRGEHLDLVRRAFQGMVERQPDNPLARAGLGWALLAAREVEPAIELLEQATRGDSAVAPAGRLFARLELGDAYMASERFDEAAAVLAEAAGLDSSDVRLAVALGECQLRRGDPAGAAAAFGDALAHAADPGAVAAHIAQVYHESDKRPQAIQYYERALEHTPDRALVLNNLAWAYAEERRQLDRAEALSLAAVKAEPDNVVYLDTYAEVLHLQGQHQRAVAVMRRALELEPEDGDDRPYLEEQQAKFRAALGASAPTDAHL